MPTRSRRRHDVVILGATGFAGRLTAEYLARHAPARLRWALAGRNREKLENVRARLATIDSSLASLPLLDADVTDPASLRAVASATGVVVTTVGPYVLHGEPVVAACAAAGTDYLDLTGEPEFVDAMYVRHHDEAVRTGARLVHAAGFDSIPHDLGAWFTVRQLPEGVPLTVAGYVRANAAFSGGTFHSAIEAFARPRQNIAAARERSRVEGRVTDREARAATGRPHRDPTQQGWAVPLPTLDPKVVVRSARADERYGPDFTYSHFASLPHLYTVAGAAVGLGGVAVLAQLPPAKRFLLARIDAGSGPSAEKREKSWFSVTFTGEGGGQCVTTRVSGGDPGYDETAKMLAESAICLALDDLPETAGQVTTATAMGGSLLDRLRKAGMIFEVL